MPAGFCGQWVAVSRGALALPSEVWPADVIPWWLVGIQPAAPGYAKVRIKPVTPTGLDFASATVGTPGGELSSSWRRVGHRLRMEVEVPGRMPAEVFVPASGAREVSVAGGQARFLRAGIASTKWTPIGTLRTWCSTFNRRGDSSDDGK